MVVDCNVSKEKKNIKEESKVSETQKESTKRKN